MKQELKTHQYKHPREHSFKVQLTIELLFLWCTKGLVLCANAPQWKNTFWIHSYPLVSQQDSQVLCPY